jgi:hypothetical protein
MLYDKTSTQHKDHPREPISASDKLILLLGLGIGLAWFICCLMLSENCRGLTVGDSTVYLNISNNRPSAVFFFSSARTFGYPLYLSIFRYISNNGALFLPLATAVQLLSYFLSITFLFLALRSAGLRLPWFALSMLYAHPAFIAFAAITLSESLTTSLIAVMTGILIYITREERQFILRSALLGLLAGITLAIRPPAAMFINLFAALSALSVFGSTYFRSGLLSVSARRFMLFIALFGAGFLPVYGHLLNNCHRSHGQFCLVPAPGINGAILESIERALAHSRVWGIIEGKGLFRWGLTNDQIIRDCKIDIASPTRDLAKCYVKNLRLLPRYFFNRLLGIFDNRHINPCCAVDTPLIMFWTLRVLSAIGLIGLVVAAGLFISNMRGFRWAMHTYLLVPFLAIGFQVNLHPETRYILPVIPIVFALGVSQLTTNLFKRRWHYFLVLGISVLLVAAFFIQVAAWDARV